MEPVRFGTLGAARITSQALLRPAARLEEAEVVAVAARDLARARRFAEKRRIPRVVSDYEALINDPDIDAVYNPLPNGLHGRWTIAALEAGKHVLCEKPFTANAAEAEEVAAVATESGKTCAEAFHYRYHPLWARALDLVAQGAVGRIEHVEATMCVPLFPPNDIRWSWPLAGGALMDIGCYAVNMVRSLAGAEPAPTAVRYRSHRDPRIDRWLQADLTFPSGVGGRVTCALTGATPLRFRAEVRGEAGTMTVRNPTVPQLGQRIVVETDGRTSRERVKGEATFYYRLRAFCASVRGGLPVLTPPEDAVANMAVIDAIYRAADLPVREPTR